MTEEIGAKVSPSQQRPPACYSKPEAFFHLQQETSSMSKKSKPTHPAVEKLAQAIERCQPMLLSNVPVAMSPLPNSAKIGYVAISVGVVVIRIVISSTAWLVRTNF